MDLLIVLRNFMEGHRQSVEGEWDLSKVGNQARELQNKTIGIFGFGRIGQLVAERLKPFNVTINTMIQSIKKITKTQDSLNSKNL